VDQFSGSGQLHRDRRRRQYRFTAGQRYPSYGRAIFDTKSRALSGLAADVRSRMRSASRQLISTTGSGSGDVDAESHTQNGGEDTQLGPVGASRRHRKKRGRSREVSCPVTHPASCCSSSASSNRQLRSISGSYSPKSIRSRPWLRGCRCRRRGRPPSHLRRVFRRSVCRGSESSILRVPSTS
jgi:hypothetical protein